MGGAAGRWVDGNSCDSWLMLSTAQDPPPMRRSWNRSRDREAYSAGLDRWIRYFEELNISVLGLGAVVLRRRESGTTWIHADHLADNVTAPAGAAHRAPVRGAGSADGAAGR